MTDLEVLPLASHIMTERGPSFMCELLGGDLDARETIVRSAQYKPTAFLPAR